MNIVSWKCQGLGYLCVTPSLKSNVCVYNPYLLFLSETLSTPNKMEDLRSLLGV